jgi:hypothetical protein
MKATNSDEEPVPINTNVAVSNISLQSFFCGAVSEVGLFKVI